MNDLYDFLMNPVQYENETQESIANHKKDLLQTKIEIRNTISEFEPLLANEFMANVGRRKAIIGIVQKLSFVNEPTKKLVGGLYAKMVLLETAIETLEELEQLRKN